MLGIKLSDTQREVSITDPAQDIKTIVHVSQVRVLVWETLPFTYKPIDDAKWTPRTQTTPLSYECSKTFLMSLLNISA